MAEANDGKTKRGKVSIWRLATGAYGIVFKNLGAFAALAIIPMALNYVLLIVLAIVAPGMNVDPAQAGPANFWWWVSIAVSSIVASVFAVAWHRFVLLRRRDSFTPAQFRLGPREIKFFLYVVLLSLPWYVSAGLTGEMTTSPEPSPILVLAMLVVFVGAVFAWLRLSFILPATAIDAEIGLGGAWHATWGVSWRILWATVLVGIPWGIVIGIIMGALGQETYLRLISGAGQGYYLVAGIQSILGFLAYALMVSVLSLAFRRHTGWSPDATAANAYTS